MLLNSQRCSVIHSIMLLLPTVSLRAAVVQGIAAAHAYHAAQAMPVQIMLPSLSATEKGSHSVQLQHQACPAARMPDA